MSKTVLKWILLSLLLLTGLRFMLQSGSELKIDNAYVSGQIVDIVATTTGVLKQLSIHRGDNISRGQILFAVDDTYNNLNIKRLLTELKFVIKNEISSCMSISASKSEYANQIIELELHQRQKGRSELLAKQKALSGAELEIIESQLKSGEINVELEKHRLDLELYKNRFPILERELVQEVLAKLEIEFHKAGDLIIRSPYDGYIYDITAYPGKLVTEGERLAILVSSEEKFVEANVLETKLEHIKIGTKVKVISDISQEKVELDGIVHSIVPSTASVFSPIPRNNTNSNWIKTSQRVPILVSILNINDQSQLLPLGSSVQVIVPLIDGESVVHAASGAPEISDLPAPATRSVVSVYKDIDAEASRHIEYNSTIDEIIGTQETIFESLQLKECQFR